MLLRDKAAAEDAGKDSDSTATEVENNNSKKRATIVGSVVGVGAGLILALVTWYFWRRANKRRQRELEDDDASVVDATEVAERSDTADPPPASRARARRRTEQRNAPPRRRIVQEDDALDATRHMPPPPSYGGGGSIRGPVSEAESPPVPVAAALVVPSSRPNAPATPPATLKAEYARAFGSPGDGQDHLGPSAPAPLKSEYAQAFGLDTPPWTRSIRGPRAQNSPQPSLKEEYKRNFGPRSMSASAPTDGLAAPPVDPPATHGKWGSGSSDQSRTRTPESQQHLVRGRTTGPDGDSNASAGSLSRDSTPAIPPLQEDYKRAFRLSDELEGPRDGGDLREEYRRKFKT